MDGYLKKANAHMYFVSKDPEAGREATKSSTCMYVCTQNLVVTAELRSQISSYKAR